MGTEISLNSSIFERVEKYLHLLYEKKKYDSIDDVRLQMFLQKYKQFSKKATKNEKILKIRKLDGSSWPPCSKAFLASLCPENKENYVCCKTMDMFLHAASANI